MGRLVGLESVNRVLGIRGSVGLELLGAFGLLLVVLLVLGSYLHRDQTFKEFLSPGMYAIAGRMGAGKTYLMTWCVCRQVRKNRRLRPCPEGKRFVVGAHKRPIYANYRVRGAEFISPQQGWAGVLACPEGSLIVLDEMHLWWPSDDWKVEEEREAWCSQLRKLSLTLLWSAQDWSFASKRCRRLTFLVWEGRPALGGHRYCAYPPSGFEQFRSTRGKRTAAMWVRRKKSVMRSYDTRELVAALPRTGLSVPVASNEDGPLAVRPGGPRGRVSRPGAGAPSLSVLPRSEEGA